MRWSSTLLAVLATSSVLAAEPSAADRLMTQALRAHAEGKAAQFLEFTLEAQRLAPGDLDIAYNLACAYGLLGNAGEAARWLNYLASVGAGGEAQDDRDFDPIRETPEFRAALANIRRSSEVVSLGRPAFTIADPQFAPVSLAYDPVTHTFLVASRTQHRIIGIAQDGSSKNVVPPGASGFGAADGIAVDVSRRVLWACSVTDARLPDTASGGAIAERTASTRRAAVFKFDLRSGRLRRVLTIDDGQEHRFRDVAVDGSGNAFIVDDAAGTVYAVFEGRAQLERLLPLQQFRSPSALAVDDNGEKLFVAHAEGIAFLDMRGGVFKLGAPRSLALSGITWLGWWRGSLIAVQPGVRRVLQLVLNNARTAIQLSRPLIANVPLFEGWPGGGTIADDTLFLIGNSSLPALAPDGTVVAPARLAPGVVLRVPLR